MIVGASLIPVALKRYAQAFPHAEQFHWNVQEQYRPSVGKSEEEELKIAHVVHMSSAFCSAGDAGKKS